MSKPKELPDFKKLFRDGYLQRKDDGEICLTAKGAYEFIDLWDYDDKDSYEYIVPHGTMSAKELIILFKNGYLDYDWKTGRILISHSGQGLAYDVEKKFLERYQYLVDRETEKISKKLNKFFVFFTASAAFFLTTTLILTVTRLII